MRNTLNSPSFNLPCEHDTLKPNYIPVLTFHDRNCEDLISGSSIYHIHCTGSGYNSESDSMQERDIFLITRRD